MSILLATVSVHSMPIQARPLSGLVYFNFYYFYNTRVQIVNQQQTFCLFNVYLLWKKVTIFFIQKYWCKSLIESLFWHWTFVKSNGFIWSTFFSNNNKVLSRRFQLPSTFFKNVILFSIVFSYNCDALSPLILSIYLHPIIIRQVFFARKKNTQLSCR